MTSLKKLMACAGVIFCSNVLAQVDETANNKSFNIPVIDNAKVFADFSDELPAVINYFTSSDEASIIAFYQNSYGEALTQERKRGRLTLTFADDNKAIRVVISQQNKKRQVDILVDKK